MWYDDYDYHYIRYTAKFEKQTQRHRAIYVLHHKVASQIGGGKDKRDKGVAI